MRAPQYLTTRNLLATACGSPACQALETGPIANQGEVPTARTGVSCEPPLLRGLRVVHRLSYSYHFSRNSFFLAKTVRGTRALNHFGFFIRRKAKGLALGSWVIHRGLGALLLHQVLRAHMGKIRPAKVAHCKIPEDAVNNRGRHLDSGVALHRALRFKLGKEECIAELFKRDPVL